MHAKKSSGSEIPFDLATQPEVAIQTLLILEWLKCFQQNSDFRTYCEVKRNGDAETCALLEKTHARIAELYDDWGDIHVLPPMTENSAWADWIESKQHLFMLRDVSFVNPVDRSVSPDGTMLIELDDLLFEQDDTTLVAIPNGLTKDHLRHLFDEFVSRRPEILGDGPKYEVKSVKGKRLGETLKLIQRAYMVYMMLTVIRQKISDTNPNAKPAFTTKAVEAILRTPEGNRLFGFNWSVNGELNRKLFEQGKRSPDEVKDYARTLNNLNKFYQACINNTIFGIFPVASKR